MRETNANVQGKGHTDCLYPEQKGESLNVPCYATVKQKISQAPVSSGVPSWFIPPATDYEWQCVGKEVDFLPTYSQSGCFTECRVQGALHDKNAPCLPWNFLGLMNGTGVSKVIRLLRKYVDK